MSPNTVKSKNVKSKNVKRNDPTKKAVTYKGGKRVRSGGSGRGFWVVAVVVIVIGVAGIVAATSGSKKATVNDPPAPAAVVKAATSIPKTVFDQVGVGTATAAPKKLSPAAPTEAGKPRLLYIGAEFCPYCATERWAMVTALSRFGTFTGLKTTHSSSTDVFPNTQTFSFHGSTYTSPYLVFTPVETETNQIQGDGHVALEKPTAEELQLVATYDVPPFSGPTSSSAGAIPFLYFAGKYVSVGATYNPAVLQGMSASAIATALSKPTTAVSQGAIGAANTLTATICSTTGNQPAAVCSDPMIQHIESSLK